MTQLDILARLLLSIRNTIDAALGVITTMQEDAAGEQGTELAPPHDTSQLSERIARTTPATFRKRSTGEPNEDQHAAV